MGQQNTVQVQGQGTVSADYLNTLLQGADNVAALRQFIGAAADSITVTAYIRGMLTIGDGGQGFFYWNAAATNPIDDGINTIVPTGAATGCWSRLSLINAGVIAATATGTNAISLVPIAGSPTISAYKNYQLFSFVAAASSTGNVTLEYQPIGVTSPLGFLPLYLPGGSQAANGSITSGTFYMVAYVSSLNANAGGFQIVSAVAASASTASTGTIPQGRLTLTSNTPVMVADTTAATTIYYTPYVGNQLPIYNGVAFVNQTFAQLTLTTTAGAQLANGVYDVFAFLNAGVATIGFGPAWSSATSRGSGAGTTQLVQVGGLWTNAVTIACNNGATSYPGITANTATYLGTVAITSSAGQMTMQFKPAGASGGTNNFLCVYNAYNRVRIISKSTDSAGWTYATSTWRALDGSTSNRVTFVDGLQQSAIQVSTFTTVAPLSGNPQVGANLDSTSATPLVFTQALLTGVQTCLTIPDNFLPQVGLHYVQAMESSGNATTASLGIGAGTGISLELDM